jgi:hypothetical protein
MTGYRRSPARLRKGPIPWSVVDLRPWSCPALVVPDAVVHPPNAADVADRLPFAFSRMTECLLRPSDSRLWPNAQAGLSSDEDMSPLFGGTLP